MDRRHPTAEANALSRYARRDRELEAGSRAHYDDPAYYTRVYKDRTDDVDYYVALARRIGGPVLEYGVGNGRIALPIARAGLAVTGVDHSAPMLADFRSRLAQEPAEVRRRVRLRSGDMRRFRAVRRFRLVTCPFNAMLHLYTRNDVERFLGCVRRHLSRGGTFAFDISVPDPHELVRDPNHPYHSPRLHHPAAQGIVKYTERFDYDILRQILFVMMEFTPVSAPNCAWATPLAHRQIYPQELEALLHYNGFVLAETYGDFAGKPFDRYSNTLVAIARTPRAP